MEHLDADARDLLELAGLVIADRLLWTDDAMRSRRYRSEKSASKDVRDPSTLIWSAVTSGKQHKAKTCCAPKDRRAVEWSVLGAVELAADDPDGLEVVRALDLLLAACRGWTISRVEDALGREWVLWCISTAIVRRPGLRLSPRGEREGLHAVDRKGSRDSAPATLRSSGRAAA